MWRGIRPRSSAASSLLPWGEHEASIVGRRERDATVLGRGCVTGAGQAVARVCRTLHFAIHGALSESGQQPMRADRSLRARHKGQGLRQVPTA